MQAKVKRLYEQLKSERKWYIENHTKVKGYGSSRVWHRVLLPLLKLLRIIEKQHITVIGEKHTDTAKPVIYACTHIGFYDPMILIEVIKKPCWLFWGNPLEDLVTLFGWMARKNGAVIIPCALEQDGKEFFVNIGRNIQYEKTI